MSLSRPSLQDNGRRSAELAINYDGRNTANPMALCLRRYFSLVHVVEHHFMRASETLNHIDGLIAGCTTCAEHFYFFAIISNAPLLF